VRAPRSAQLALDLGHRPALGARDFLVAPGNRQAVAWLDRWPAWQAPGLVVYGPRGCGKSHLVNVWRARSGAAVVAADTLAEASAPTTARALAVEDAGGGIDETALLHLYNMVVEGGGTVLLTAADPPARWGLRLPDLASRLAALPAVAVGGPDDRLLAAVLVKLFADRQLEVAPEVIEYLLARIERSFDAAGRVVEALDRASLAGRRRITVPFVGQVLSDQSLYLQEQGER
jgi:chromosomal replication initiation ATPase DnaA